MKVIYKGVTYRTENLSDNDKKLMAKEIQLAKDKAERLNKKVFKPKDKK